MNREYFEKSKEIVLERESGPGGIGTLGEKCVHSTLKQYFAEGPEFQEIKIGPYFADVCRDGRIFEIQTRQFNKLRDKLAYFLPDYKVTVVYPVSDINYLCWIDPQSGEVSEPKKSTHRGNPLMVFAELYRIREFLTHPNFSLKIMLLETKEFRLLDGYGKYKKAKATKCDKYPVSLINEYDFQIPEDYMLLLPDNLSEPFLARDFAKAAKIPLDVAQTALLLLTELSVVKRVGKDKNAYFYEFSI